jgi:hypothetical protein
LANIPIYMPSSLASYLVNVVTNEVCSLPDEAGFSPSYR